MLTGIVASRIAVMVDMESGLEELVRMCARGIAEGSIAYKTSAEEKCTCLHVAFCALSTRSLSSVHPCERR